MQAEPELIEFIEGKLLDACVSLASREEMERVWRGGADKNWRAVGCYLTKEQRIRDSDMHGRIAARLRLEVEQFKKVRDILRGLPPGKLNL